MTNNSTFTHYDQVAHEAFAQWRRINPSGPAAVSQIEDWDVERYRDAVCFVRKASNEFYLVRANTVVHCGLDLDSFESAYRLSLSSSQTRDTGATRYAALRHFRRTRA